MKIKNILIFTVLTVLVPLAVDVLIKRPTPSYQFIDLYGFIKYFAVGLIGAILTLASSTLSDATVGAVIGSLIYPIDVIPFLISTPADIIPTILLEVTAVILGAYVGSKIGRRAD